jgi:hypothetical protein
MTTDTSTIPPLDLIDVLSTSVEFKEKLTVRPSDEANLVPIVSAVKEEMENRYGQKFEKSKRVSLANLAAQVNWNM